MQILYFRKNNLIEYFICGNIFIEDRRMYGKDKNPKYERSNGRS